MAPLQKSHSCALPDLRFTTPHKRSIMSRIARLSISTLNIGGCNFVLASSCSLVVSASNGRTQLFSKLKPLPLFSVGQPKSVETLLNNSIF
jgi:hypothetical protein